MNVCPFWSVSVSACGCVLCVCLQMFRSEQRPDSMIRSVLRPMHSCWDQSTDAEISVCGSGCVCVTSYLKKMFKFSYKVILKFIQRVILKFTFKVSLKFTQKVMLNFTHKVILEVTQKFILNLSLKFIWKLTNNVISNVSLKLSVKNPSRRFWTLPTKRFNIYLQSYFKIDQQSYFECFP